MTGDTYETDLEISIRPDGPARTTVIVSGELDAASSPDLDESLARLMSEGVDHLVVDLSDVSFLDSSGLRSIIRALNALAERNGTLRVSGVSPAVQRILEVTGMLEELRGASGPVS